MRHGKQGRIAFSYNYGASQLRPPESTIMTAPVRYLRHQGPTSVGTSSAVVCSGKLCHQVG